MPYVKEIQKIIAEEQKELEDLENTIDSARKRQKSLIRNFNKVYAEQLSPLEKATDALANFAGSWTFISGFLLIMATWITINGLNVLGLRFDPFPFILLNLILSTIAALQAPVILMSQKRISDRDRERAEHDYGVNMHAELEIEALHDKVDYLLTKQWSKLLDIQATQIKELESIRKAIAPNEQKIS